MNKNDREREREYEENIVENTPVYNATYFYGMLSMGFSQWCNIDEQMQFPV